MVYQFLRLFPAFRFVEAAARDLSSERNLHADQRRQWLEERRTLQDRLDDLLRAGQEWKERGEKWEAKYHEANADAIKAREIVADFIAQMRFGKKIFEHAPALPDKPVNREPLPKMRQQARVRVQQDEARFARDLQSYVTGRVDGKQPTQ